ncbi:MAG: endolytic transglycosylase MltG, partial [Mycobacteriales bacterium]
FPKVAAVIYNRLARGMPLQMDSTINYVLPERKGHLTADDIRLNSPYNTYRVTGLPPTPIGSPGELALRAALSPTPGDLLYFVTIDKAGHNAFTSSYAEFLQLKAQGARNRG